jgi:hypothetical protein
MSGLIFIALLSSPTVRPIAIVVIGFTKLAVRTLVLSYTLRGA